MHVTPARLLPHAAAPFCRAHCADPPTLYPPPPAQAESSSPLHTTPSRAAKQSSAAAPDAAAAAASDSAAARLAAAARSGAPLPYIVGTSTPVHGWFQFCRGCGSKTARTHDIGPREVALCHDCQTKWAHMVTGALPRSCAVLAGEEPLSTWIPGIVRPGTARLSEAERRLVCQTILLHQDDAWASLVAASR